MPYLLSSLIAFSLIFAEVSLAPHFLSWLAVPSLVLPFISIISIKDRTIFPIILAGLSGLVMDAVSANPIPFYSIAYISIAVISKVFLGIFVSYGEFRANLINMGVGLAVIYGSELAMKVGNIQSFDWMWVLIVNIPLAFLVLAFYMWAGRNYFSWIEKETEERFRQ